MKRHQPRLRPLLTAALFVLIAAAAFAQTAFSFSISDILSLFSSNKITVIEGNREQTIRTNSLTVSAALNEAGLDVSDGDYVAPGQDAQIHDNMSVYLTRSFDVYVQCGEKVTTISVRGGTVRDALSAAGYSLDSEDHVQPSKETLLTPGMRIKYVSIDVALHIERVSSDYSTVEVENDDLFDDEKKVVKKGVPGERTLTYEIIYENGIESGRRLISSVETKSPIDQVVHIGTLDPDDVVQVSNIVKLKGDPRKDFSAPKLSEIEKVLTYEVTAYHDNLLTATGTWPNVGTIAVNPKQIPYGTKLYVDGYGYGVAADTGGFRHSGKKLIDLYMNSESECDKWGRRRDVKVYVLKD